MPISNLAVRSDLAEAIKKNSDKQKIGDASLRHKTLSLLFSIFSYYVYNSEGLHCSDRVGLCAVGIEMNFSVAHVANPFASGKNKKTEFCFPKIICREDCDMAE